jgi:hypothetical protein
MPVSWDEMEGRARRAAHQAILKYQEDQRRAEQIVRDMFTGPDTVPGPPFSPPPTGSTAMSSIEDVDDANNVMEDLSAKVMDTIASMGEAKNETEEAHDELEAVKVWLDDAIRTAQQFGMPSGKAEQARQAIETLQQEVAPIGNEIGGVQGRLSQVRHTIAEIQQQIAAISQE